MKITGIQQTYLVSTRASTDYFDAEYDYLYFQWSEYEYEYWNYQVLRPENPAYPYNRNSTAGKTTSVTCWIYTTYWDGNRVVFEEKYRGIYDAGLFVVIKIY